jgi:protease-4
VGGDAARLALQDKLVDGLKTRDELRQLLVSAAWPTRPAAPSARCAWREYLRARQGRRSGGDRIGVVVAEGEIFDGEAPPGRIGGRSTAELIRKARDDDAHQGAACCGWTPRAAAPWAAELVRRELELTLRAAGKTGWWCRWATWRRRAATGSPWPPTRCMADAAHSVAGSIGVLGMLPTAPGPDGQGVGGHRAATPPRGRRRATTRGAPLDPRFERSCARGRPPSAGSTRTSSASAATARKTTPDKIDDVAQGRVWTGNQAQDAA